MGAKVKKLNSQNQLALKEESQVLFLLGEEKEKIKEVGHNFHRGLDSLWNALFHAKVIRQIEPGKYEDATRKDDNYFYNGGLM